MASPTDVQRHGRQRYRHAALVDVETTGLNPARDEVVELAVVLFAFDWPSGRVVGIVDEYAGLREPAVPIPRQVVAIHGISMAMVKGRCLDDGRVRALFDRAECIIAHNARFDRGFVSRLYPPAAEKPWLCSLRQIDWRSYGFRSRSLESLLAAHGIRRSVAHRAAADCRATLALLTRPSPRGSTYLKELLVRRDSGLAMP